MMDWLYGELAPEQRGQFSGHVDSCARCTSELASFERTRSAMSALEAVEPPQAVSAILLHEAAAHAPAAPKLAAGSGGGFGAWITRTFAPLMHPAAAAVATLLLVIGIGGTIYMTQGDVTSEPRADLSSEATTAAPKSAVAASEDPAVVDDEEGMPTESQAAVAKVEGGEVKDADKPADNFAGGRASDKSRSARLADNKTRTKLAREYDRDRSRADRNRSGQRGYGLDAKPGSTKAEGKRVARKSKAKMPPPAVNALSGADPLIDGDDSFEFSQPPPPPQAPNRGVSQQTSSPSDRWAANKETELRKVAPKDCGKAAKIANDIRDKNPTYYNSRVSRSTSVKRCQRYVRSESAKRARARKTAASKSKAKSNTGKASPKKSAKPKRAAPAADESVETSQ